METVTISPKFQVVIPKGIRDTLSQSRTRPVGSARLRPRAECDTM